MAYIITQYTLGLISLHECLTHLFARLLPLHGSECLDLVSDLLGMSPTDIAFSLTCEANRMAGQLADLPLDVWSAHVLRA